MVQSICSAGVLRCFVIGDASEVGSSQELQESMADTAPQLYTIRMMVVQLHRGSRSSSEGRLHGDRSVVNDRWGRGTLFALVLQRDVMVRNA